MAAAKTQTKQASVKVASAQYPIGKPADLFAWQDNIEAWVKRGAATEADLLVFPEYAAIEQAAALGPEIYKDLSATLRAVAEQAGERIAFHVAQAKAHNVHILAGSGPVMGDGGRITNAAQLITPNGLVGQQHKMIMTPFEVDWGVSPGNTLRVFDTALGLIGITICYDSEFPLLARALAQAGAELLLVPSCTERVSGYSRVRTGAQARALENQIAVVTSPTVGDALWSPAVDYNAGSAGVFVPPEHGVSDTGVVAEGTLNEPSWVTAEIDLAALRALRTNGEMRNFSDWQNQPGAGALPDVEVVSLR